MSAPTAVATSPTHDVVIVGAGIVGATLACALAQSGVRVAVIDKAAHANDRRVSALTLAGARLLQNIGVWSRVDAEVRHPIARMRVWEAAGRVDFTAAEIGAAYLGYVVPNGALLTALHHCLRASPLIELHAPCRVDAIAADAEGISVRTDTHALRARLVVAADGGQSQVRALAGLATRTHAYAQHGIVAELATARANRGIAWQRFLPTGPLALLPLADNRYSLVWSLADAAMVNVDDDAAFVAALRAALGEDFVRSELGEPLAVGPRARFPLYAAHALRYVAARVALVGDAAHVIHPLAGQGLNLGLLDAGALAQSVQEARARGRDIGSERVLRRYERWRKGDTLAMLAFTHAMERLFGAHSAPIEALRNKGLNWTDRFRPIKRGLIRQAAGLSGELPALCRESPPARPVME